MKLRKKWIPSTSALLAFEAAARHRHFSRAADELNTSQSAISRHIAALEDRLGTQLFDRTSGRPELTAQGETLYRAAVLGLDTIQNAASSITNTSGIEQVVIACTHEISHLFIMPRFDALQEAASTPVRVMTYDYETLEAVRDPNVDIIISYEDYGAAPSQRQVVLHEAVTPVCAPALARDFTATLHADPSAWADVPYLELTKSNRGWATWNDWFARQGVLSPARNVIGLENYVYLLEAAATGRGLALGWRGMIERYLDSGALIALRPTYEEFDRPLYAVLTPGASDRNTAHRCLAFFESEANL